MKPLATNSLLLKLCWNKFARRDINREIAARAASGCQFLLQPITYTHHRSSGIFGQANSRALAEAWGAALLMAPLWVLGSVVAWLSAMPLR